MESFKIDINEFERSFNEIKEETAISTWEKGDSIFRSAAKADYKKVAPQKLASFIKEAMTNIYDGLISLCPGEKLPFDAYTGIVLQVNYAVCVSAVYLNNSYEELLSAKEWTTMWKLMNRTFGRGIIGHGWEAEQMKRDVMIMLCEAGADRFLEREYENVEEMSNYVDTYAAQQREMSKEIAGPDNRNGKFVCFQGWDNGKANAYIHYFNAAWRGFFHPVFVYGTLMHGECANHMLTDSVYLGKAKLPDYALYDLGAFPGVKEDKNFYVLGEVYFVNDEILQKLDTYENEGALYKRNKIGVESEYGKIEADVYVYLNEVKGNQIEGAWNETPEDEVWYATYGSSMQSDRFRCYIQGGICQENGRSYPGCTDKTTWTDSRIMTFPGRMYFGNSSKSWEDGGVAFYTEYGIGSSTIMRLYRIKRSQLRDVQKQEGSSDDWYGRIVFLGYEAGLPIYTLTSAKLRERNTPCASYVNVIKNALIRECGQDEEVVEKYIKKCQKRKKDKKNIKT